MNVGRRNAALLHDEVKEKRALAYYLSPVCSNFEN